MTSLLLIFAGAALLVATIVRWRRRSAHLPLTMSADFADDVAVENAPSALYVYIVAGFRFELATEMPHHLGSCLAPTQDDAQRQVQALAEATYPVRNGWVVFTDLQPVPNYCLAQAMWADDPNHRVFVTAVVATHGGERVVACHPLDGRSAEHVLMTVAPGWEKEYAASAGWNTSILAEPVGAPHTEAAYQRLPEAFRTGRLAGRRR